MLHAVWELFRGAGMFHAPHYVPRYVGNVLGTDLTVLGNVSQCARRFIFLKMCHADGNVDHTAREVLPP